VSDDHKLLVIDFGCIKDIPESFYQPYFEMASEKSLGDPDYFEQKLYELEFLAAADTPREKAFFKDLLRQMLLLLTEPFRSESFDFSNENFFQKIAELGQHYTKLNE